MSLVKNNMSLDKKKLKSTKNIFPLIQWKNKKIVVNPHRVQYSGPLPLEWAVTRALIFVVHFIEIYLNIRFLKKYSLFQINEDC